MCSLSSPLSLSIPHPTQSFPHRRSSQSCRRCLLRPETTVAGTPTPSPTFHLPQLVFSPVNLEEPPFARHRGRAAATTRGPPPAGAPSFFSTRHQQRRMTPPSTPSHDVQPLTSPETLARIRQRQLKEGAGHGEATRAASSVHTHRRPSEGASQLGLANYVDKEEDEHRGPRGRANGRPREEEEDERRALKRRPR
ncbi:hypothetical protein ACQJBY_001361 [Aegilops geniculata]